MSAGVVYDGIARRGGGDDDHAEGSGSGFFRNVKFWLAQKVPSRLDFITKILANGGGVVALEKMADILIADLVRKDVPPNAYSWKFIDECIKQGRLVDKEPFGPVVVVPVSRPVGSARPAKGTRTPFTKADDEILTKWVMRKEMRRGFIKGNIVYQQLEQKYPHHTYQSWRDRWVKKLQYLPRPAYASEELEAIRSPSPPLPKPEDRTPPQAPDSRQPSTLPASTAPPAAGQFRPLPPTPRIQPPRSQPQRPFAGPPQARVKFTAEDDELLQQFVGQVMEAGGSVKGNEIYKDLEQMYPHHTFQSWRSRYIDHLHGREAPASTPAPAPAEAPGPARTHQAPISTPAPATQQPVRTSPQRKQPPQEPQASASAVSVTPYASVVQPPEATPRRETPVEPTPAPAPVKVEEARQPVIPQTPHDAPRTASWTGARQSHRSPSLGTTSRLSVGRSSSPASIEIQRQVRERTLRQEKVRREREAAKLIQRVWRGHLGRLAAYKIVLELESAEAIQRTWRSHSSRQRFQQAFSVVRCTAEEVAMTVQRLWRGWDYRARLSRFLEEQAEAEEQAEGGDGAFEESSAHHQHKTNGRSGAPRSIKEQFHADLDDYLQLTEEKIDFWPKIHGRSVQLWDLYQAINEQMDEDEGGHCDWEQVAERLGFDWIRYPAVVQEVARCYEKNLEGFMLAQAEFDEQSSQDGASGDDAEEVGQTPVAARRTRAAAATAPTTSPLPSSPPRARGLKRRYGDSVVSHDSAYPPSARRKRGRVDRNREIPSTPEEEIQQAAKHAEMYRATSPTPIARRGGLESSGRVESDDGESSQQLPPLPRPAVKRVVEPDAQDFRYDPDTQMVGQDELEEEEEEEEEVDDVTPSQQLRGELGMVTPIPLRLSSANKAAAARMGGRDGGEQARGEEDVELGATPQSHHRSDPRSSLPPIEALPVPKTRRSLPKSSVRPDRTPPAAQPRSPSLQLPSSPRPVTGPSHRLTVSALRESQAQVRRADINAARAIPPPPLPERQPEPQPRQRGAPAGAIDIPDSPSDGDDGATLAAVVERYMSMGYPQDVVLRALKATTGVADGLAGVAMESLMRGEGLPAHHEGIWTARDDEVLGLIQGVDWGRQPRTEEERRHRTRVERARSRLAHKHGEERIEERKGFLRMYRAGQ